MAQFFMSQIPTNREIFYLDSKAEKEAKDKVDFDTARPYELNSGDLLLMHPFLIQGSCPTSSNKPRVLFINGFSYAGANTKPYPGEGSAQRLRLSWEYLQQL